MTVCERSQLQFQAIPRSFASPLFHRYGDDAQLREITGYKPVAVVRLQQQREQQAGVPKICRAFHQQSMPSSVHALIFMHVVFHSIFSPSSYVSLAKEYIIVLLKR